MKRTLSLILAMLLALTMLFAASADELEMSDVANMTAPGVLPIVVEPVDLTIATAQNVMVTDYDDNALTKFVEEQTGIHVVWDLLPAAETATVLDLRLASGETLPDIIAYGFGNTAASYGDQGYFQPLNEFYDKYSYFLYNGATGMTEMDYDQYFARAKAADGNIYGYAYYTKSIGDQTKNTAYINRLWLDKLGLAVPTNLDELYNVLVAFRDNDMNGNGETTDEFPAIGSKECWNGYFDEYFINCFTYYNQDYMLDVKDNVVYAPFVTEEWQNAMIFLNKLVAEGLLAPVSFTMKRDEYVQLLEPLSPEEQICGMIFGSTAHIRVDKSNPYLLAYDPMVPLENQYTPERTANVTPFGFITCDCQIPEIAFRYMDFFAQEKVSLWTRYGVPGDTLIWRDDDPEAFDATYPNGSQRAMMAGFDSHWASDFSNGKVDPWSNENNVMYDVHWFCMLPAATYSSASTKTPASEFITSWEDAWEKQNMSGYQTYITATLTKQLGILPDQLFVDPVYTVDEIDSTNDVMSTVQTYVKEMIASFTTGAKDPVADWDEYIEQLEAAGLQQWLDLAQAYWDRH